MDHRHDCPVTVSLKSARGWKQTERATEDIAPKKFSIITEVQKDAENDSDAGSSLSDPRAQKSLLSRDDYGGLDDVQKKQSCGVCREHEARYTCPKCQLPYCSIDCYKNHATSTNAKAANACTEAFFQEKVASLMKLESLEKSENAHRALNKYHRINNEDQRANEVGDDDVYELYQLWSELEALESDRKELSLMELSKVLPASLRARFEQDLHTGKLQNEVLKQWHPWWERELVANNSANNQENMGGSIGRILDERLLKVPDCIRKNRSATNNEDVLFCNLVDILYATCKTLRLYHGVENASKQAPVEAATILIGFSSVLGKDARFSTLPQVLNHLCCVRGETTDVEYHEKTQEWQLYIQDIASLVLSQRLVGRAILEGCDILKAAIQELKSTTNSEPNTAELNHIRRLRKKLEFYLSWNVHHWAAGERWKEEIEAWIAERNELLSEYKVDTESKDGSGVPIASLKFPSASAPSRRVESSSTTMEEPLLIAVESRRKL